MSTRRLFISAIVCGALVYATVANRRLDAEFEAARAELARVTALSTRAMGVLVAGDNEAPAASERAEADCALEASTQSRCECATSDASETIVLAPDGLQLRGDRELDEYARRHLDRRIAAAFPERDREGMNADQRAAAVDLLMQFRELRRAQIEGGEESALEPVLRDELLHKQGQFSELTGMGIGEFLAAIVAPEPATATEVFGAVGPVPGEERKRFADEAARLLGIAEPGSREVLEDGRWQTVPRR